MTTTATAELHVRQPRERVAATLDRPLLRAHAGLEVDGGWEPAPWTTRTHAWRRVGRWDRGRAHAEATIDLIDAGPHLTILSVSLSPRRTRSWGTITADTAHAVASQLRGLAESDGPPAAPPSEDVATRIERPVLPGASVGYSEA